MSGEIDVSALGISVDLTDVNNANKALDELAGKADKAQASLDNLAGVNRTAATAVKDETAAVKASTEAIAETAAAIDQATQAEQRRINIVQQTSFAESDRSKAERDAAKAIGDTGAASTLSAAAETARIQRMKEAQEAAAAYRAAEAARGASVKSSTVDTAAQTAALSTLIGQIDPTVKALERLDQMEAQLKAHRASGTISTDDFTKYTAAIQTQRDELGKTDSALSHLSLTSGSTVKEFGVLARELSTGDFTRLQGSIVTLTNRIGLMPLLFTAAGAAVAGVVATLGLFVAGAIAGYTENQKLMTSIVATGNAAGETASSVNEVAKTVGDATGKYAQARESIQALTDSGRVFTTSLNDQVTAISNISLVTGKSVEQVVDDFKKLQDDPIKAITALNDQYHFLSLATADQITQLQNQGKAQEAATLAEKTYSDAFAERAKEVQANLGFIQKAWNGVSAAASAGWDDIKGIGRQSTTEDQLKDIARQIQAAQQGNVNFTTGTTDGNVDNDKLQKLLEQQNALRGKYVQEQLDAQAKSIDQARQDNAIKSQSAWDAEVLKYDKVQQKKLALAKAEKDAENLLAAGQDPAQVAAGLSKQKELIDKQYKPTGQGNVYGAQLSLDDSAFKNQIKSITDSYTVGMSALKQLRADDTLDASQYTVAQLGLIDSREQATVKELQDEKDALSQHSGNVAQNIELQKKMADIDQQITSAQADAAKARTDVRTAELNNIKQFNQQVIAAQTQAANFTRSRDQQSSRQLTAIGQGGDTAQLQQALDAVSDKYNSLRDNVVNNANQRGLSVDSDEVKAAFAALDKLEQDQVSREKGYASQRIAAQSDWTNGLKKEIDDYQAAAANIADQTAHGIGDALSQTEDAFFNLARNGKLSLQSLESAVADSVARMASKQATSALTKLATTAINAWLGTPSTGSGFTSSGGNASDYSGIGSDGSYSSGTNLFGSANGNVFGGGSLITSPTLTPMANGGTSLRGEAETEGVFPLTRTSDGKLGVSAAGAGTTFNVVVQNNNGSNVQVNKKQNSSGGFDTSIIVDSIKSSISDDISNGRGSVHDSMVGRFGLDSARSLG